MSKQTILHQLKDRIARLQFDLRRPTARKGLVSEINALLDRLDKETIDIANGEHPDKEER